MKKLLYIIYVLGLIACQEDFDEINDTQQRHVTFSFNAEELFSKVLTVNGGSFRIGEVNNWPADYRMRITIYGYDHLDSLVYTKTMITEHSTGQAFKVWHLLSNNTYRFVFIADVVKYDSYVDYFETWFQLGTTYWPKAYIYSDERNADAVCNSMGFAELTIIPENQDSEVIFHPITYNGFCIFNDLNSIDRLSGYVMYCSNFNLKNRAWQKRNSHTYRFDERNVQENSFVMPVSLCDADSVITVKIRAVTLLGADSTIIDIPNKERRPFVATFNCMTLTLDDCKYY